jgi:hypothetical protein
MSRTLSRLLALGAAAPLLGTALVVAAPAAQAAVLPVCTSTPVYDFNVAGTGVNRLAVDVTSTQVRICFTEPTLAGVLVLRTTLGVTPPTVTQTTGTLPCAQPVWDSTQPVSLHISVGADATGARSVCFSMDGDTTVVTFGLPSVGALPGVELWRTGTWDDLDVAACLPLYLTATATGGSLDAYHSCVNSGPTRII